ncbi:hypothetical protein IWW50_000858 [Coemansia erecta]|nr:hypothetical protein IWW50_000858 [Coemansia erecta]
MSSQLLFESFYETMNDFSILAGNLEQTKDKWLQVVIDKNNLNYPDYKETQSNVHFDTVKEAKYNTNVFPKGAVTTGPIVVGNRDGQIKLVTIHVLRLKDNSGVVLFVCFAHALIDGVGFTAFMKRWSELCACMASQGTLSGVPKRSIIHDRAIISKCVLEDRDPVKAQMDMPFSGGMRSRLISGVSPQTRGKILSFLLGKKSRCFAAYFYVPRHKLQALRESLQGHSPDGFCPSDNEIITSLLCISIVQSQGKPHKKTLLHWAMPWKAKIVDKVLGCPPKLFGTTMAVDIRSRSENYAELAGYCGNAVVIAAAPFPLSELQVPAIPELLIKISMGIRSGLRSVDAEHVGRLVNMINSAPDFYLRPHFYGKQFAMQLGSSNMSRSGWYGINFGWGIPEFVILHEGKKGRFGQKLQN